jgi:hypothetical protein
MNLRGFVLVVCVLLVSMHARAAAIYDWVPKTQDGSSGQIVLRDDTTVFDPEHPNFSNLPGHDNQLGSFTFTCGNLNFSGGPGETGGLSSNGSLLTPDTDNVIGRLIYYVSDIGHYLIFQIGDEHTTIYPSPGGIANAMVNADGTWRKVSAESVPDASSTAWLLASAVAMLGLVARRSRKAHVN